MTELLMRGVIPALVTPRDDILDDVDLPRLAALVRRLLAAGVHGLFPASSTGEAPLLTREQRRRMIETVAEAAGGAVPVLAGAGAASTAESILLAQDAQAAGASHLAVMPAHFVRVSPEELYGYFAAVAESVALPVVLYNYPGRSNGQIIPASVASRLAASHNVVGIKDSSGDLVNTLGYVQSCPPDFAVFVGPEALIFPALTMGCAGTICAAANVVSERIIALYEAFQQGDWARARRHQEALLPLKQAFAQGTFPAAIKAALAVMGSPVGAPFPPALPLSPGQTEEMRQVIVEAADHLSE